MKRNVLLLIFSVFGVIFLFEIGLRLFYPVNPTLPKVSRIKPFSPIKSDSVLGYTLEAGEFLFEYEQDYSFQATHNNDGWRITGVYEIDAERKIFLYGGSFFKDLA